MMGLPDGRKSFKIGLRLRLLWRILLYDILQCSKLRQNVLTFSTWSRISFANTVV